MKYFLIIIILFSIFGFQVKGTADDGCSHKIKIRIISNNKFYIEEKQELSKIVDSKSRGNIYNVTLKWHFSSRRRKISVSSNNVNKLCSILISKDEKLYRNLIDSPSKSTEIVDLIDRGSGKCKINYKILNKVEYPKNKNLNLTYTVTDKF